MEGMCSLLMLCACAILRKVCEENNVNDFSGHYILPACMHFSETNISKTLLFSTSFEETLRMSMSNWVPGTVL